MILCWRCHTREIQFRKERNRELSKDCQFKLPTWDSLKIYGQEEPARRIPYNHSRSLK